MNVPSLTGTRILVIVVARIGDTLLATPLLRALKSAAEGIHLSCLAHPHRRAVLMNLPWIDELGHITPRLARWRGWWSGAKRWDYAVVLGKDVALVRYAQRVAAHVVAFEQSDEKVNAGLWRCVAAPRVLTQAVQERLLLAEAIGVTTADFRLAYRVTADESAWAQTWLRQHGVADSLRVGIQLSSFATKSYRDWPLAHFQALLERLFTARPDAVVVVVGDRASAGAAYQLQTRFPGRVFSTCGTLKLRQSAALLSTLNLYIGVDTGPTHLAGALGLPMVALYHCAHRGRYLAPQQHPALRVVEHPVMDAACSRTTPMAQISVEQVWAEVQTLLQGSAGTSTR